MWQDRRLEGVAAKLGRAQHQLEQFRRRLSRDANIGAYGILQYMDEKELIIKANLPRALLINYSVLAGEIVHQMRSALDHLIYAIVPTGKNLRRFPVFTKECEYYKSGVPILDGLDPRAAAFIEALQPFGPDNKANALNVLNSLWNRDKHRLLLVTKVIVEDFRVTYTYPDGRQKVCVTKNPAAVKDRADLLRMRHPLGYNAEVEVIPRARFGFYFDSAGLASKKPVLELLFDLLKFSYMVVRTVAADVA